MKKLFYIAAVALLTLGMTSCEREDDDTTQNQNQNTPSTPTNPSNPTNPTDTTSTQSNPWENPNPGTTSGQWVDLGLSVQWYSVNLGAAAPEQYGDYYAWGETATKSDYSWSTYAHGSNNNQLTKYCDSSDYGLNGFTDNLTTLQSSDDAATAVLGGGARIPTQAEWQELLNNTTREWTTQNGVYGRKFTATNGNSLFLPAAGTRVLSDLMSAGESGHYWSASLGGDYPCHAWHVTFLFGYQCVSAFDRYYGFSVRAVRSQN